MPAVMNGVTRIETDSGMQLVGGCRPGQEHGLHHVESVRVVDPVTGDFYEVNQHSPVVAPTSSWNYSMKEAKPGRKMLLLTEAGIAIIGHIGGNTRGYIAWAPLPDRDKVKERELGL